MIEELTNYLKNFPAAREASNRNQAVWGFLSRKYGFEVMDRDWFWKHGQEVDSVRREISDIQKAHKELRGTDYVDRAVREQKYLIKRGYEPGYSQLSTLHKQI